MVRLLAYTAALSLIPILPAYAQQFDLSQASSIVISTGNSSATVTTADVTALSLDANDGCNSAFSSTFESGLLTILAAEPDEECSLSVQLPESFPSLRIESSNGDVSFTGTLASLAIDSANGDSVVIDSSLNSLSVATSNGGAVVRNVDADQSSIDTTNGAIVVQRLRSRITITTTNGRVLVKKSIVPHGTKNTIRQTNGSISVTGLKVRPPVGERKARLRVKAYSTNGAVRIRGNALSSRKTHFQTFGSGRTSAVLSVRTVNGAIVIK